MNINFFSGVGGWELGLELAQALFLKESSHLYVDESIEIDETSLSLYSENFYKTFKINVKDYTTSKPIEHSYISFPCNGTSQNGKKLGLDNEHSSLWHNCYEVSKNSETLFIEQPVGFLSNGADIVVEQLLKDGFKVTCILLTARMFALPHRRERVFIIASNSHDPHLKYWSKSCWNDNFRENVSRIVAATREPQIITSVRSCNNGFPKRRVYNRFKLQDIKGLPKKDSGRWQKVNSFSKSIVPFQTAAILSVYL